VLNDYEQIRALECSECRISRLYSTNVPDDNATLVALACTSRMFSEHALDRIWESAQLWHLAHQMNETLWRTIPLMTSPARRPDGTVGSDSDFRRVRCLVSTSGDVFVASCSSDCRCSVKMVRITLRISVLALDYMPNVYVPTVVCMSSSLNRFVLR
jgi:hypothetical protein